MEIEEKEQQELDILVLLEDFLQQARRLWILGLVLVLLCGGFMTLRAYSGYQDVYEAYASFTVRVANPLYGSISSYNEKTAQVMADTFPSILTSDLLQKRVAEKLGISRMPTMAVSASVNSSILTLRVRDTDPQRAYDVLNAVIECYPELSEFVVGSTTLVLLDESGVPSGPATSFNAKGYLIRGGFIGGVIWCALMAAMVLLKNTIHNENELKLALNIPCIGEIINIRLTRRMPYPLIHRIRREAGFQEAVRLMRLRVEKAMEEQNKKVLLISSAIPGEGKTTVSSNLAVSLAQKGRRVLLIDCDLRNPSVAKVLGTRECPLAADRSLLEHLQGRMTAEQVIQDTVVENLSVITGGTGGNAEHVHLLSGKPMMRLVKWARETYDYVILDTSPCSMLADAAEVAALAEAGLMVVRQDFAGRDQIVDGIQRLNDGNLPMIGCVFNNIRKGITSGYGYGYGGYSYNYGYGYGSYGYGNGYGYGRKKSDEE